MDPEDSRVEGMVRWPAVGILVAGALGLVMQIASFAFSDAMNAHILEMANEAGVPMSAEQLDPTAPLNLASSLFGMLLSIGMIVGGWAMLKRTSWALALTGAICALIPCSTCCCIGLPFGVWALIVLLKPEVKAAMGASVTPS